MFMRGAKSRIFNKTLCNYVTLMRSKSAIPKQVSSEQIVHEIENLGMPFSSAKIGHFLQEGPRLGNQYLEDAVLKAFLQRHVPKKVLSEIEPDIERFGERVSTELYQLSLECERDQPRIEHYDAWGNRVDKLITSSAWKKMHDVAAEEGLVACAYERKYGEWSRLYQMAKLYLYSPSAGLYSCPLAMTDGAAKIIETIKDKEPWLVDTAYNRLTSRDPTKFWTSGQWMTERKGGSDVAQGTETQAIPQSDGSYKLYGYKWFSSATDSDMTFTLARVVNESGATVQGTRGLSLFYMETRDQKANLNNIYVQKLKQKLGTRQVPTAELLLEGSTAYKVSEEGRGVAAISNMLTMTRIHNAMSAASGMRRITNLARDYSTRRKAFGGIIKKYPLHIQTLARMEVEVRAATLWAMETARLLGREEVGMATEQESHLIRLVTPLAKLYTGKQAMEVISEGLECFGGQGYIEDTGLPAILRDAQVLTIWEGTTNILSLDVLRAISKSQGQCLSAFRDDVETRLHSATAVSELSYASSKVQDASDKIVKFVMENTNKLEMGARDLAYSLSRTFLGALLIEHAGRPEASSQDVYVAQRWCEKDLAPVLTNDRSQHYGNTTSDQNYQLVFDSYWDQKQL